MNDLVIDLLKLAASEHQAAEMKEGDLSKTAELAVLTFEGKAFESGVALDYDIEPVPPLFHSRTRCCWNDL